MTAGLNTSINIHRVQRLLDVERLNYCNHCNAIMSFYCNDHFVLLLLLCSAPGHAEVLHWLWDQWSDRKCAHTERDDHTSLRQNHLSTGNPSHTHPHQSVRGPTLIWGILKIVDFQEGMILKNQGKIMPFCCTNTFVSSSSAFICLTAIELFHRLWCISTIIQAFVNFFLFI